MHFENGLIYCRSRLLYGLVTAFSVLLLIGQAAQLMSNIIGFVYPAYMSIKVTSPPPEAAAACESIR